MNRIEREKARQEPPGKQLARAQKAAAKLGLAPPTEQIIREMAAIFATDEFLWASFQRWVQLTVTAGPNQRVRDDGTWDESTRIH